MRKFGKRSGVWRDCCLCVVVGASPVLGLLANPLRAGEPTKPVLVAHRGGAGELEENTITALRTSYEKGLRGFEIDIRMLRDGTLVVLHDDSLDRTHQESGATEKLGPVEHRDTAGIAQLRTKKLDEPLLLLSDVLDFFEDKPGVYLELEMKTSNRDLYPDTLIGEYCSRLLKMAEPKKPEGSIYLYTSFDTRPLSEVRKQDSEATTLLIMPKPVSAEFVAKAKELGVNYIGCRLDDSSRAEVRAAQKAGLKVTGWPGKGVADYKLAAALGLDSHCTDFPLLVAGEVPEAIKSTDRSDYMIEK